jgi:hypothetical protein
MSDMSKVEKFLNSHSRNCDDGVEHNYIGKLKCDCGLRDTQVYVESLRARIAAVETLVEHWRSELDEERDWYADQVAAAVKAKP